MFFKDLDKLTKKQIFWLRMLFNSLYMICMLVVPLTIICIKYKIGQDTTEKTIFAGWSLILILTFTVIGLFALAKVIRKLPDSTMAQQRFKYTLELVKDLSLPICAMIVINQFKINFDLAYDTICGCLVSLVLGILLDNLIIKYLDKDYSYQQKAVEENEINKRKHRV